MREKAFASVRCVSDDIDRAREDEAEGGRWIALVNKDLPGVGRDASGAEAGEHALQLARGEAIEQFFHS